MGTKRWIFFAPGQEDLLCDQFKNLPFNIDEKKCHDIIQDKKLKMFEITQKAGQTIFVPSGWHHQVWNLEDTISVNHNWFNGCNIMTIWLSMLDKFHEIQREIDDCKDMDNFDGHCQLMLKSVFGLDFQMFFDILNVILKNRLLILKTGNLKILNEAELGTNHTMFDLQAIRCVVQDIYDKLEIEQFKQSSQQILSLISETIT